MNSSRKEWRCFHCDEVFTTYGSARNHFGVVQGAQPVCLIKAAGEWELVKVIRKLEDELARYRDEDSDIINAMASIQSDHRLALQREEEKGYARGLEAGKKLGAIAK